MILFIKSNVLFSSMWFFFFLVFLHIGLKDILKYLSILLSVGFFNLLFTCDFFFLVICLVVSSAS